MNIFRLLLTLLTAAALPVALHAQQNTKDQRRAEQTHRDGAVSVQFENMEDFTDFGRSFQPGENEQQALAEKLRAEIKRIAPRYLADDRHLDLTFLDIDMAGEFEPHRGAEATDVRIVRGIYTPSFHVEYKLTDRNGEVVSSGQRRISDLDFQNTVSFRTDETLFYETELARQLISRISRGLG